MLSDRLRKVVPFEGGAHRRGHAAVPRSRAVVGCTGARCRWMTHGQGTYIFMLLFVAVMRA
jgi:hypothetical protein